MPISSRIPLFAILAISAVLIFVAYCYLPIIPFAAAFHGGTGDHRLVQRPLAGDSELQAVAGVLDRYGEHYWTINGTLLITPRLCLNSERRWNYTSKAGL